MLRDSLVGLIEPIQHCGAGASSWSSRCCSTERVYRTIDPQCLENPRAKGRGIYTNGKSILSTSR